MNFIQNLEKRLTLPLPGKAGQATMSPSPTRTNTEAPNNARIACILALFYPKNEKLNIVLIERANNNPNDRHGGQISFPGGKLEEMDASLLAGALREAEEEVGIKSAKVKVLGALTELYIPVSNFKVYPFLGYLPHTPDFIKQETEVKSILEIPFEIFLKAETRKQKDLRVRDNFTLRQVPYYDVQNHVIWGATSMILSELITCSKEVLSASNSLAINA